MHTERRKLRRSGRRRIDVLMTRRDELTAGLAVLPLNAGSHY
jgi:hypothetical protein